MCLFGFATFGKIIAFRSLLVKSSYNPLLKDGKTEIRWKQKYQLGTHCVLNILDQNFFPRYDFYRFLH